MQNNSTDQAKKRGIHKDNIDHQFRWGNKRQQDRFVSTTIPSCDGIVAAALCKDGPIHYHTKEFSGIDDALVFFILLSLDVNGVSVCLYIHNINNLISIYDCEWFRIIFS